MCGIAGLFTHGADPGATPSVLRAMLGRIAHRGPDAAGLYVDDRFGMGTARLSIIDVAAGAQPMADAAERAWIAYNGELYNYVELRAELEALGCSFRTRSDTEVVLQAWLRWGAAGLPRLNGGFVFAIYEPASERLVVVRDRFGKRPLFYAEGPHGLLFASEMKAFLAVPGFRFERDPAQVAAILGQWTPLPDQSGFQGLHSLPMGEWLEVAGGRVQTRPYEALRFDTEPPPATEAAARQAIRAALEQSVALRLRSDVEVGVYLSGGLDSAVIAALASRLSGHPLRTFSVEFEDRHFDESAEQRLVAGSLGTRHEALRVRDADITDAFPDAVYHAEVPAFRSAFVPMYLLSRRVREAGIKVVLTGEGADEAFLGYDIFRETRLRAEWPGLSPEERSQRSAALHTYLPHFEAGGAAAAGLYQQFSVERMPGLFSHELRFQNGRFCARLLKDKLDPFAALQRAVAAAPGYAELPPVQKAQWLEFRTLLAGYLLSTQGERMSLAHSVENRCPFLDPGVVGIAAATNWRFDDGAVEKRLLREAFRGDLPASIIDRKKHPYRAPDSAAFVRAAPAYLEALCSEAELKKLDYLNPTFALALVHKIRTSPPERISTKENQAFIFLLSLVLLDAVYVRGEGLPALHPAAGAAPSPFIDRRSRSPASS
jgi:asparagine synthase (glutamine-hydrolysing)